MAQKKKDRLSHIKGGLAHILDMALIVPRIFSYIGNLKTLVKLEARLAGRSLAIIIMLSLVAASLLTIIWICVLSLLFLYFVSLHWSVMSSLVIILLLNIILLMMIGFKILKLKRNLFFPETCEQLHETKLL